MKGQIDNTFLIMYLSHRKCFPDKLFLFAVAVCIFTCDRKWWFGPLAGDQVQLIQGQSAWSEEMIYRTMLCLLCQKVFVFFLCLKPFLFEVSLWRIYIYIFVFKQKPVFLCSSCSHPERTWFAYRRYWLSDCSSVSMTAPEPQCVTRTWWWKLHHLKKPSILLKGFASHQVVLHMDPSRRLIVLLQGSD